jgi:Tfp pilus assembly PilM family ATPase
MVRIKQSTIGISTQEKKIIQKQIAITDKQIDQLVYDLYDLTEEEIKIVEGDIQYGRFF